MPANLAHKQNMEWTWSDYQTWPEGECWEIIGGDAFAMSPAPSTSHQSCTPFVAPTDVKLSETDVVQPDILVVCDPRKITPACIDGVPDLVVEVLSPGTATRDLREKKALYAKFGVKEYLIVDPLEHYAMRFVLEGVTYDAGTAFGGDEMLVLATFEGIEIPLWEVFALPVPGSVPVAERPSR
jgi:Uma2 family endonuclease